MKTIVIISDLRHIPKVRDFMKNATIIATNLEVEKYLQKEGLNFKSVQYYIKLKSAVDYYLESKNFMQNWISKNPNFNNLLGYKNLHLFDIMEFNLIIPSDDYYYYSLEDIIKTVDFFKAIFKKEKPDKIIAVDDGNITTEILKTMSKPILIKSKKISHYKKSILNPLLAQFLLKFKLHYNKIRNPPKDFRGKIVTIAAGYNYITPVLPLIEDMKSDFAIIKPLQIRTNKVSKLLKKENIPFASIESFLDKDLIHLIKHNTKKLTKNFDSLLEDKSFISSFEYRDVPIFSIFKQTFNYLFKKRAKILEFIINVELYKKILKELNPKLVLVVEEENLHSRIILRLAKQQKIPTLYIQHGVLNKIWVKDNYLSDKILVWEKAFKEGLLKYNKRKEGDILATGRLTKKEYNTRLTLNRLNIPPNKKIITFATNVESDKELILEVLNVTKKLHDVQLIIKLHPAEDGKLQKRLAKLAKPKPIITRDMDIDELMNISDLVIVKLSTVGLIALEHYKPLISVDYEGIDEMKYIESGAAVGVNNLKDLKTAITTLLYDEEKKEELLKKARLYTSKYFASGDSLQKTKTVIKKIIN